jgi:SAM-dependent methyltransferase
MLAFYRKLLGHPFVYDRIRPRVVGGIDMRQLYELLAGDASRVVLDVGCGTGDALNHLTGFDRYLGVDTDPVAIEAARARFGARSGVSFECRELHAADVADLAPTGVVLSGVLHHLSNTDAEAVLRLASGSPRLVRVATSDIVFLPGAAFNNVLAMLDRGRFCRDPDAYAAVARRAGLEVDSGMIVGSAPDSDRVRYWIMALAPPRARERGTR